MTKKLAYPTPVQVGLVVNWANRGTDGLMGSTDRLTYENVLTLRDLIYRLHLPAEFDHIRVSMLPRHHGVAHPAGERLRAQLMSTLRFNGYVHPLGKRGPDGTARYARTPLTGYQLHLLRLLASGVPQSEIHHLFGVRRQSVQLTIRSMRDGFGCTTTTHFVAQAYGHRWLPTFAESLALRESGAPPQGKPYRELPGDAAIGKAVKAA